MRSVPQARRAHPGNCLLRMHTAFLAAFGAAFYGVLLAPVAQAAPVDTTSAERAAAANVAVAKVGSIYRFGAAGPTRFDCSGLVVFGFNRADAPLGVRTSQEMWNIGARIRRSALQRGDLVYTYDRNKGHVGIYIGNGRYVHAPGPGRKVQRAPLPTGADYIGAIRP